MTPWLRIMALGPVALSLAACSSGSIASALGMGKRAPDEFAVVRQQPLVIPPDFQLRPPGPGEATASASSSGDRVRANLTGQPVQPQAQQPSPSVAGGAATSAGTSALLARTGGSGLGPEVLPAAVQEAEAGAEVEETLLSRLLEAEPSQPQDATVDAITAAERLSSNPADGPPTPAGEAPTVLRRDQTPLGELVEKDS